MNECLHGKFLIWLFWAIIETWQNNMGDSMEYEWLIYNGIILN